MKRFLVALACSALVGASLSSACGTDERLSNSPDPQADAGKDVAIDTTPPPDSGKDSGPIIRKVETRPRFGSLDPGNFLLDGDFEYSGMDAVQYPWFGVEHSFIVTGARCRSGLRCVEIPLEAYVFGTFVWPEAGSIDVSYYAKPLGTGSCTDEVGGIVIPLADYPGAPQANMVVSATEPEPGPDGWCHVSKNLTVPSDTGNVFWALLLAPRQSASDGILVDDAAIRIPGSSPSTQRSGGTTRQRAASNAISTEMTKLVARARSDFAKRPPTPPRGEHPRVENRTGRRGR